MFSLKQSDTRHACETQILQQNLYNPYSCLGFVGKNKEEALQLGVFVLLLIHSYEYKADPPGVPMQSLLALTGTVWA